MKIDGGLDDLRDPYMLDRKGFTQASASEAKGNTLLSKIQKSFTSDSRAKDKAYFTEVNKRLEELGLDTLPKQWNFIHRGHKREAIIVGLEVGGISIGALLTIANSRTLTHLFSDQGGTSKGNSPTRY